MKRFMNGNGIKAERGLVLDIIVGGKKINAYLGQLEGEEKLGEYLWVAAVFSVN